jgi:hypothetical protein
VMAVRDSLLVTAVVGRAGHDPQHVSQHAVMAQNLNVRRRAGAAAARAGRGRGERVRVCVSQSAICGAQPPQKTAAERSPLQVASRLTGCKAGTRACVPRQAARRASRARAHQLGNANRGPTEPCCHRQTITPQPGSAQICGIAAEPAAADCCPALTAGL